MNLLIVESPAKAKTIEKYLGKDWHVVASVGHVRDLVPENGSVDPENDFSMKWQIMPGKEKQIKLITDELKKADTLYLASDPDREGEAIAWHLLDILTAKKAIAGKPVYRVVFHEITKNAINEAIKNPRKIDNDLVDAYLVRRALDYLIGFNVSPLLWRRNLGRSAGRVQSVAVKLVVDRESEIEVFKPVEYWSLTANCEKGTSEFSASLAQFENKKIEKLTIGTKGDMDKIVSAFSIPTNAIVSNIDKKHISRKPYAPFTTSTLQQESARKLHFSSKRTMGVAQKLYEQGLITYMRTDATNLSAEAVNGIRDYIVKEYGNEFLPKSPNIYVTKSKNAQEAHEAIRPTNIATKNTDLDADAAKLYDLIWKRTIACQMTNAEFDSVGVDIKPKNSPNAILHSVGTTQTFAGFLKVYQEGMDDDDSDEKETKLPQLEIGNEIEISKLIPEQHFTMPPPRYTEASLVKKLEELGIGRPSTYATIMSTIVDREYVKLDKQRFFPTPAGWLVAAFLTKYFPDLVAVDFTAKTEDALDDVSNGKLARIAALTSFWSPVEKMVAGSKKISTPEVMDAINTALYGHLFPNSDNKCPECGSKLELKVSKYGAFLGCSKYPECKYTKQLGMATQSPNSDGENSTQESGSSNKDLGEGISFKIGRFGPYVTDGKKNTSAKKYTSETITLEIAQELLSGAAKKAEGLSLGTNPATGKDILYFADGRYGAYISSNKVNVGVKEQPDLESAIDLINNKKPSSKKTWGKKK